MGPATTARLAADIGEGEQAIQVRLAAMESANLIDVDQSEPPCWSTPASGIYFEIPEQGEDVQRAARALSGVMLAAAAELPMRWIDETEPQLPVEWARAAGLLNARLALTADESRRVQEDLEHLLEPFNTRDVDDCPPDAAMVRVLAFFMPEPGSPAGHRDPT
jgi:hypothetical protein